MSFSSHNEFNNWNIEFQEMAIRVSPHSKTLGLHLPNTEENQLIPG